MKEEENEETHEVGEDEEAEIFEEQEACEIDDQEAVMADEPVLIENMPDFSRYNKIRIIACGSATHAGLVGKQMIERD